ncbi:MAG: hypothetical protein E4H01_02260 [Lysobacterales bacterium]|nr:MAG: hypothetical protein E4H01_02260 [Xanthomonadales bacterium]
MKKLNVCLIVFAIIAMVVMFTACVGLTGPEPPDPNEQVEYYDYTVTYIRPQGSIVRPEMADPPDFVAQYKNEVRPIPRLTKINDYEFTGTLVGMPTHLKGDSGLPPNYIYVVDPRRWVDMFVDVWTWGRPHSVGDIFKLKNNKTGAELTLTNIVTNTLNLSWPVQCNPKAAQFWTIKGGTIHNSWPY